MSGRQISLVHRGPVAVSGGVCRQVVSLERSPRVVERDGPRAVEVRAAVRQVERLQGPEGRKGDKGDPGDGVAWASEEW